LVHKIVPLKTEKERKADPIAFVMNGKTELTPYRKFHVFDHIAHGNVNMTSIKSFFKLYEVHKECEKFRVNLVRALNHRFTVKPLYNDHFIGYLGSLLGRDLCLFPPYCKIKFVRTPFEKPLTMKVPRKHSKTYQAFTWFFAIAD
jgi:hypothetical protein